MSNQQNVNKEIKDRATVDAMLLFDRQNGYEQLSPSDEARMQFRPTEAMLKHYKRQVYAERKKRKEDTKKLIDEALRRRVETVKKSVPILPMNLLSEPVPAFYNGHTFENREDVRGLRKGQRGIRQLVEKEKWDQVDSAMEKLYKWPKFLPLCEARATVHSSLGRIPGIDGKTQFASYKSRPFDKMDHSKVVVADGDHRLAVPPMLSRVWQHLFSYRLEPLVAADAPTCLYNFSHRGRLQAIQDISSYLKAAQDLTFVVCRLKSSTGMPLPGSVLEPDSKIYGIVSEAATIGAYRDGICTKEAEIHENVDLLFGLGAEANPLRTLFLTEAFKVVRHVEALETVCRCFLIGNELLVCLPKDVELDKKSAAGLIGEAIKLGEPASPVTVARDSLKITGQQFELAGSKFRRVGQEVIVSPSKRSVMGLRRVVEHGGEPAKAAKVQFDHFFAGQGNFVEC